MRSNVVLIRWYFLCSSSDRSRGKISVGTIGIVENGFGISILPYMDIVRLHHITAIPVQTSSWKSKFYIARRKYGIRTAQEEAFFQHWRK